MVSPTMAMSNQPDAAAGVHSELRRIVEPPLRRSGQLHVAAVKYATTSGVASLFVLLTEVHPRHQTRTRAELSASVSALVSVRSMGGGVSERFTDI
jgi:hypothetical protein